jgi:hypothetical protein
MNCDKKIKFAVEDSLGNKAEFSIPSDTRIDEYVTLFKSILTFLTFNEISIKELFAEDEY